MPPFPMRTTARVTQSPRFRGFTLLELLAVVAIVGILISLLFAGYQNVIGTAYGAKCAANMRQIYTGFIAYSADHSDTVVPVVTNTNPVVGSTVGNMTWNTLLVSNGYLPRYGTTSSMLPSLQCPANHNGYQPGPIPNSMGIYYNGQPNYMYDDASGTGGVIISGVVGSAVPSPKLSNIRSKSTKAFLFEGGHLAILAPYQCHYRISPDPTQFDPTNANYKIDDVHNNTSNVLFWDGHIETLKRGTINWQIANW